jgi:hypothetical protein
MVLLTIAREHTRLYSHYTIMLAGAPESDAAVCESVRGCMYVVAPRAAAGAARRRRPRARQHRSRQIEDRGAAPLSALMRMMQLLLLQLLLVLLPAKSRGCTTGLDCSLNGKCSSATKTCACNKPWSGPSCAEMRFKPVTFPQGYGMTPNLTAWGGGAIYDPAKKQYHSYVHVMNNGCPLRDTGTNSRIEHGVAQDITGPYKFVDVAIGVDSRNSVPKQLSDGTYAIFHIGSGAKGPDAGRNCSAPDSDSGDTTAGSAARAPGDKGHLGTIHVSSSLSGPWIPLEGNTLPACSNPAPHIHPNGTYFIVCNHHQLYRSPTIQGPWTQIVDLQPILDGAGGSVFGKYEDPYMYQDHQKYGGNWHVIYHVYNTSEGRRGGKRACFNTTVSGHIFSEDGLTWYPSPIPPFGARIALTGGTAVTVSTRERPYVYFDAEGEMTHLFNAVSAYDPVSQLLGRAVVGLLPATLLSLSIFHPLDC